MSRRRVITHTGVRLAYERSGSGPLVVLVQGLGLSGRMWMSLPFGLARAGYDVVTVDNRGTGASDTPRPPYRMADLADDLARVITDVDAGPAVVVGISFGGMIAQHLALRHPELVRGLVLAATSCGPPLGSWPRRRASLQLLRALLRPGDPRRIDALLVHPSTIAARPQLLEAWHQIAQDNTESRPRARGVLGQVGALMRHNTGFQLGRLHCPTEVVTGDSDRIIAPSNARVLAERIQQAKLTIVPQAGHLFAIEDPSILPRLVRRLCAPARSAALRP